MPENILVNIWGLLSRQKSIRPEKSFARPNEEGSMFKLFAMACAALWATTACALTSGDGVRINEIYVSGPSSYSEQDGFIEFYNAGSETAYLDGALVLQGLDTFAQLAFKFPGEHGGQSIAMPPGSFLVLATDAYNHAALDPVSPNLVTSDFETVVPNEQLPGDNGAVANMTDVLEVNFDLFFVRRWGQIILTTGEFWNFRPCLPGEACGLQVCQVPLETVVDGVEYLHHVSFDSLPLLNDAIDAGVIVGIEPWTGQSAERISPGQDTNNSGADFRILPFSTPGFQSALSAGETPRSLPTSPLLISACPNPFNPDLSIQVDAAIPVLGKLTAHDVLGREVAVIFEGQVSTGQSLFKWQANQAASGTYWLRWQGASTTPQSVRVLLLK